ncbi:hypothetical protein [Streptomyces sp. NPDC001903]|uniref:hypothetical protein n=1 Tax=Streptomyces sp. NPDC001903 TaxID=3364622 RepID=UPI0036B7D373
MSKTTPEANDHGPAPTQMSPEQAANLGLTPTPEGAVPTELVLIPASEVKPEDIGTLSIEYREGQPVIVVSGGTVIPAGLTVADASGDAVAAYTAGPIETTTPAKERLFIGSLSWGADNNSLKDRSSDY